jgi:hypothetical protein
VVVASREEQPVKISPLLWPLVGYLGLGTLVLFGVSELERLAFAIMPGGRQGARWHDASPGWVALYPVTAPFLLARALVLLAVALPARLVSAVKALVARALRAAQAIVARVVAAVRDALGDAMRAVRRTAQETLRRVRAMLGRP